MAGEMVEIHQECFSLKKICDSGQCFRMKEIGENRYGVIAFGKYLEMEQREKSVILFCTQEEYEALWRDYFDLDVDYGIILRGVDREDVYLCEAMQYGSGIRILNQDLWEMMISFIISQQNNIKRIRKCIQTLCERFGEKKMDEYGGEYFDFPTPDSLAKATEEELKDCNLGYRSRYIKKTAQQVVQRGGLSDLAAMTYTQAQEELMKFFGIGEKVSNCICLFALRKKEAFPVDTHIRQVLQKHYPQGFPFEQYKENAGVIQQYIFYYDLMDQG